MPKSEPLPDWGNADVYIVGGGASLSRFDFTKLAGRHSIGCNQAFRNGFHACKICTFCDFKFWEEYGEEIATFKGWVATNYLTPVVPTWLKYFTRQHEGLAPAHCGALAFNFSTGGMSINLALALGARRVFLLGFDCCKVADKAHWHKWELEPQLDQHYDRFICGFDAIACALPSVYPDAQIFNVTDGSSGLKSFPICSFEEAEL